MDIYLEAYENMYEPFEVFGRDDIRGRTGLGSGSVPSSGVYGYPLKRYDDEYGMELSVAEEEWEESGRRTNEASDDGQRLISSLGIRRT